MANRHRLIAGATGTGKTVTLRVMADQFSRAAVPVFLADVKGDLSGIARPRTTNPKIQDRLQNVQPSCRSARRWSACWTRAACRHRSIAR
jgi:DNA helicase HerA-like ATPase